MRTNIDCDGALLSSIDAGDRIALARITRRVVARLRAVGAYDLKGQWDDACAEIVTNVLEATRSGVDDRAGLQRRIDRAVWLRMAAYLRRSPLSDAIVDTRGMGVAAPGVSLESDRPHRMAARQAFARIARERQELLWRRYLDGEAIDRLTDGSARSARDVERELVAARAEFRNLLDITSSTSSTSPVDAARIDVVVDGRAALELEARAAGEGSDEGGSS